LGDARFTHTIVRNYFTRERVSQERKKRKIEEREYVCVIIVFSLRTCTERMRNERETQPKEKNNNNLKTQVITCVIKKRNEKK
jgi:hypothetical protein